MVHNVLHNPIGNTIYDDGISRIGSSSSSSGVIRSIVVWLDLRYIHHRMQANIPGQVNLIATAKWFNNNKKAQPIQA